MGISYNTDPNGNPGQPTSAEVDERIPQWISESGQYANTTERYELFIEYSHFLHLPPLNRASLSSTPLV